MGSFALVSVPVDLTRRSAAAAVALDVVTTFPGTRDASVDAATSVLQFELQFPGNFTGLVARLNECLIPVGELASVSLPVRRTQSSSAGEEAGGAEFERRVLEDGPEIWDVQFRRGNYVKSARIDGDSRLEASVVPDSKSMHQLYDALLRLRYLADDEPAVGSRL
jgi:hypothetical protein